MKLAEIRMRDPFVVPLVSERRYYLFGTTDNEWWGKGEGFNCFSSTDLADWDGPFAAFRPDVNFWADMNFWAPEVHVYNGRYFLFASFLAEGKCRGTQILASDTVTGPYLPHTGAPVTPGDWMCLDGTLYVDKSGAPWIVFCHEWTQVKDGEICARRLSPELDKAISEPILLFRASQALWVVGYPKADTFVTDGPSLYRTRGGDLLMIWSSFGKDGYALAVARSSNGEIDGRWEQETTPLFRKDGGHGMIFRTFDNKLFLSLHQPNDSPKERPMFIELTETAEGKLVLLNDGAWR